MDRVKPILDKLKIKPKEARKTARINDMDVSYCYYYTFKVKRIKYCVSADDNSFCFSSDKDFKIIYAGYSADELEEAIKCVIRRRKKMKGKDEQLTYEELANLCKKQEEYIKELENKIEGMKPSETEKCREPAKPDYIELVNQNIRLSDRNREFENIIQALLYSLQKINIERLVNDDESKHFKEKWEEEYKRANKLLEELENEK